MDRRLLLAPVAAAALAVPVVALAQQDSQPSPQALFRTELLEDGRTTSAVKGLLRSRRGFVDPAIQFVELTGDGKEDAVVRVNTGGAAGAVAVYVLSTDGSSARRLRVVYRNQLLYRAVTSLGGTTLFIETPVFERGDRACCPSSTTRRAYRWDDARRTFTRRSG